MQNHQLPSLKLEILITNESELSCGLCGVTCKVLLARHQAKDILTYFSDLLSNWRTWRDEG